VVVQKALLLTVSTLSKSSLPLQSQCKTPPSQKSYAHLYADQINGRKCKVI